MQNYENLENKIIWKEHFNFFCLNSQKKYMYFYLWFFSLNIIKKLYCKTK